MTTVLETTANPSAPSGVSAMQEIPLSHHRPPPRPTISCDQERQDSSLERLQHFFDGRAIRQKPHEEI